MAGFTDSMPDEEDFNAWPAFVDLLAASTLIFVSLVAVFVYVANREAGEFVTQRKQLLHSLEAVPGREKLYSLHEDAQFIRITLEERATFPTREWQWTQLRDSGKIALDTIGRLLSKPEIHQLYREVRILGHTDQVPYRGTMSNWELSAARAAVVARYLIEHSGMDPCRVSASGMGPYYPLAKQDNAIQRLPYLERMEKNRRIEIEVIPARAPGALEGPPCLPAGDGTAVPSRR